MLQFIKSQIQQIQKGGIDVLLRKIKLLLYVFAIPPVLVMRIIKPWLLVRLNSLTSSRIGHLAPEVELYLCKLDAGVNVPNHRYIDLFYMPQIICNQQLAVMCKRVLHIWPAWILGPIFMVNRLIPGGDLHEIGPDLEINRDVHNLMDRFPPHLKFTREEEARGEAGLQAMGLPVGAQFVCLIVRDSAYLDGHSANDWSYHNYRDSDIKNYVLAAEALAKRGYFVIRMGAKVHSSINSTHPMVIDYAANGMRNEFMDIYLGAKCAFCVSTGTGLDAVPEMLRRPMVYVNFVPLGNLPTFRTEFLSITKRHVLKKSKKTLSLSEIFSQGVGYCVRSSGYESAGVELYENTPDEIKDIVVEMVERLEVSWQKRSEDESMQQNFWGIFPVNALATGGHQLHGEIRASFSATFLRNNPEWLQ
jgi:putative glycosyltransferase (TIGR04372 family)